MGGGAVAAGRWRAKLSPALAVNSVAFAAADASSSWFPCEASDAARRRDFARALRGARVVGGLEGNAAAAGALDDQGLGGPGLAAANALVVLAYAQYVTVADGALLGEQATGKVFLVRAAAGGTCRTPRSSRRCTSIGRACKQTPIRACSTAFPRCPRYNGA